jgi:hypothetical protein
VTTPRERHETLRVLGEERLRDPGCRLRPGEVRPRDEPAEAPVPDPVAGEQDEVGAALRRTDAAVVLPDRLAMAGEAGPVRLRTGGKPAPGGRQRGDGGHPAVVAGRRTACRDHQPEGIRYERIDQLHLDADDGMEPGLLGGGGEPDDPVEALTVGDGERREAQLDGPRNEVRRGGGTVEEGEAGVRVELGIGRRGHGTTRAAWRTAARPSRRRGATRLEHMFLSVNQLPRATKRGSPSSQTR